MVKDACYGNTEKKKSSIDICNEDGQEFHNNLDMANYCNKYFTDVGIDMGKQIYPTTTLCLKSINSDFYFSHSSNKE